MNPIYRYSILTNKNKVSGKVYWLILVALCVGGWVGYKVFQLKWEHQRIQESVGELANRALLQGNHSIEAEVIRLMSTFDAVVQPEDVKLEITQERDKVTLEFPYSRIVDFVVTKRKYPFYVHVEKYPKKAAGAVGEKVQRSIDDSVKASDGKYSEAFQNP